MQTALAAAQIVDPSAAVTSRPSIVSVTVPVRPRTVRSVAVIAMDAVSAGSSAQAEVRELGLVGPALLVEAARAA